MAKRDRLEEKILDVDARMQGTIAFKDPVNLRINGTFEGKLETRGNLTIGENANVQADIYGERMIIAGKVTGNLTASASIALVKPAVVRGDISTPIVSIAEGAILDGRCNMLNAKDGQSAAESYLSLRDLAQYLEIEAKVVEEWAEQNKIPAQLHDGEWRFNKVAVDQWIQDEKIKP